MLNKLISLDYFIKKIKQSNKMENKTQSNQRIGRLKL